MCCAPGACASAACSPPSTRRSRSRCSDAVIGFFDENEALARVRSDQRTTRRDAPVRRVGQEAARLVVSALEGAMLTARPYGDVDRFQAAASALLSSFVAASASATQS